MGLRIATPLAGKWGPIATEFLERYSQQSQDVLHAFLTQSRDCIKLINTAGELEYLNANGVEALGFTDANDVVGKHWRELWPEESHAQIDASIYAALDGRPTEFEAWCPNRHGEDRWWDVSVSPVAAEGGQITHMIAISRDVTAQVKLREVETLRREAAEHQADFAGSIAGEMRHRFKNQLAVIGAIAKLLARHTDNASELARKLDEKLLALALAQDLLTESNDAPIPADIAIVKVLTASGMGDRVRVLSCPDVGLGDKAIQQLALLLGELQTNALKHGALRQAGGRIELSCELREGILTLRWHEHGAAPVTPNKQGSGGFQLIRRIGTVGGKQSSISWEDDGIIVEFHLRPAS